jgi:TonB family protein
VSALRLAVAATLLLAACGSSRPADSTADSTTPLGEPADAGVSIGRPSGGDAGVPDLPAKVVRHDQLEAQRLTGNASITPDAGDQAAAKNLSVAIKYCVDPGGKVSRVKFLRRSESPTYDAKIEREVKNWTFRPFVVEGQPADVCTVMTFLWKPSAPAPAAP